MTRRRRQIFRLRDRLLLRQTLPPRGQLQLADATLRHAALTGRLPIRELYPTPPTAEQLDRILGPRQAAPGTFLPTPAPGALI